jgi:hypothetical protein
MKGLADLLEKQGRFGDSELVHLNPAEVKMLEKMSPTGKLTTNPTTGKKEAFLPILAAVLTAVGTTAYGAKQSRKAQKRAEEQAQTRALIEGAAPNIANVQEVIPEDIQGTDVSGLKAALEAIEYGEDPPLPTEDPIPSDLSEEELVALLEQSGGLESLMMADGGPVGTPNDVYFFGVPQIMGMMQDPNPQIQQVGMQLAGQMEAMPEAGMVPATQDQIRTMAYGGAISEERLNNARLR